MVYMGKAKQKQAWVRNLLQWFQLIVPAPDVEVLPGFLLNEPQESKTGAKFPTFWEIR